jgi:hypothetical protein
MERPHPPPHRASRARRLAMRTAPLQRTFCGPDPGGKRKAHGNGRASDQGGKALRPWTSASSRRAPVCCLASGAAEIHPRSRQHRGGASSRPGRAGGRTILAIYCKALAYAPSPLHPSAAGIKQEAKAQKEPRASEALRPPGSLRSIHGGGTEGSADPYPKGRKAGDPATSR